MMIVGIIFMFMVSVAQWLRRQVVALESVGSNPTAHPFSYALIAQRNRARPEQGNPFTTPLGITCGIIIT